MWCHDGVAKEPSLGWTRGSVPARMSELHERREGVFEQRLPVLIEKRAGLIDAPRGQRDHKAVRGRCNYRRLRVGAPASRDRDRRCDGEEHEAGLHAVRLPPRASAAVLSERAKRALKTRALIQRRRRLRDHRVPRRREHREPAAPR